MGDGSAEGKAVAGHHFESVSGLPAQRVISRVKGMSGG
jgi:hypothetical protein